MVLLRHGWISFIQAVPDAGVQAAFVGEMSSPMMASTSHAMGSRAFGGVTALPHVRTCSLVARLPSMRLDAGGTTRDR
jgi:hypothetical protein